MNINLSRVFSLFLITLLFLSPYIIVPSIFPSPTPLLSPVSTTQINFDVIKYQQGLPARSQFAILIAANPHPEIIAAQTTKTHSPSPPLSYFERQRETSSAYFERSEKQGSGRSPGSYTIAVLGDSMIDVMQPDLPQLKSTLEKYYPLAQFKLLNYGVGASNIEYALERLTSSYTYLDKTYLPLLSQNPDIIVIESFAYNHWGNAQPGLDRQWLALAKIIETIKNKSHAKIVLAATIGPDETTLCDGIDGINLPPDQKREKAQTIRAYLQNLINFATSQGYPLADAYRPSLDNSGNGKAIYINAGDHLHPSGPGGELLAQKIVEAIYKFSLL